MATPRARGARSGEDGRTLPAARVQHDLVAFVQQSAGGGEAEAVRGAGDEDASHRRWEGLRRSSVRNVPAADRRRSRGRGPRDPLPVDLLLRFGLLLLGRIARLRARFVETNVELRQPRGGDPPGLADLLLLRGSQRLLLAGVRIGAAEPLHRELVGRLELVSHGGVFFR